MHQNKQRGSGGWSRGWAALLQATYMVTARYHRTDSHLPPRTSPRFTSRWPTVSSRESPLLADPALGVGEDLCLCRLEGSAAAPPAAAPTSTKQTRCTPQATADAPLGCERMVGTGGWWWCDVGATHANLPLTSGGARVATVVNNASHTPLEPRSVGSREPPLSVDRAACRRLRLRSPSMGAASKDPAATQGRGGGLFFSLREPQKTQANKQPQKCGRA
jgi:hypothetical protein